MQTCIVTQGLLQDVMLSHWPQDYIIAACTQYSEMKNTAFHAIPSAECIVLNSKNGRMHEGRFDDECKHLRECMQATEVTLNSMQGTVVRMDESIC